jgi:hypothetical protein
MLDQLDKGRIFSIERHGEIFRITEGCDNYFWIDVTKEELYELGQEIKNIALSPLGEVP